MAGSRRIEVVPGRKAAVGQLVGATDVFVRRLAHRHQHDPFACGCRPRRPLHDVDDGGDRVKSGDGDAAARLETFAVGMRMRVEEPRHDRAAGEVDEPRGGGLREEGGIIADGGDVAGAHRDGRRHP